MHPAWVLERAKSPPAPSPVAPGTVLGFDPASPWSDEGYIAMCSAVDEQLAEILPTHRHTEPPLLTCTTAAGWAAERGDWPGFVKWCGEAIETAKRLRDGTFANVGKVLAERPDEDL